MGGSEDGEPRGRLLEQLVVVAEGRRVIVPFNINWPADVLRMALRERGAEGGQLEQVYLDPERLERARPLLREVFPDFEQTFSLAMAAVTRTGRWHSRIA